MKWIDYREQLGIGIDDKEKFKMLRNKSDVLMQIV